MTSHSERGPIGDVGLRIETSEPQEGAHWRSMRPVGEHLGKLVEDMRGMVALAQGRAEDATELLEHEGFDEPADPFDVLDSWALEVNIARWQPSSYSRGTPIARVVCVLGTGGPHVELVLDFDSQGRAECVKLARYWSGSEWASTDDPRALDVAGDFVAAFLDL